jgi:hypothetical protein
MNTILTCLGTIAMCLTLFPISWYPLLNQNILSQDIQDMEAIPPPAIAWISIKDRKDSANLLDYPHSKGFVSDVVGGFDSYVPNCANQSNEMILANHYCNCSEMFSSILEAPLSNHKKGITYRYFLPSKDIMFNTTNATFVLQVFSNRKSSPLLKKPSRMFTGTV